jgi:uncharacterized membrane protein (DUF441 family)
MDHVKIVVEKNEDGFVAYSVGLKGISVGVRLLTVPLLIPLHPIATGRLSLSSLY